MKLWVNYPRDGKIGKNWIFSIKKCLKEYHFKNEFVEFRVIRGVFTWLMIGGFGLIIYGGPLALMLTVGFYITFMHSGLKSDKQWNLVKPHWHALFVSKAKSNFILLFSKIFTTDNTKIWTW